MIFKHGQTALMLAVSHGKLDTTRLLVDAGAGLNIQVTVFKTLKYVLYGELIFKER